jgi:glycerol uptake facilitator-like aquaporin
MFKRLVGEFLGTGILVAVVVGSGAMAENLTQDVGLELLINTVATVLALGLLIELFAPISGAHFNPLVSVIQIIRREFSLSDAFFYVIAQSLGGILGAMLANLMFSHPAIFNSQHSRTGLHLWLGEVVATAGLIFVIFQAINLGKSKLIPILVPAWIGAAYFFTSSTSFANPAVTLARSFTDTFSGIKISSVPGFVIAQCAGAVIGFGLTIFFKSETSKHE